MPAPILRRTMRFALFLTVIALQNGCGGATESSVYTVVDKAKCPDGGEFKLLWTRSSDSWTGRNAEHLQLQYCDARGCQFFDIDDASSRGSDFKLHVDAVGRRAWVLAGANGSMLLCVDVRNDLEYVPPGDVPEWAAIEASDAAPASQD